MITKQSGKSGKKLTAGEMKELKGGCYWCTGGPVPLVWGCAGFPEAWCGYDQNSCAADCDNYGSYCVQSRACI